ncbi:hypothetical protein HY412_01795 [Candidatus Kaiserbacteria bacterium]|nr:hypothetical protein [Candidatus Kaiserbacteria bacterium]
MNTQERKLGNAESELTEAEKVRLAELEVAEKAARLGGGDVCVPSFTDEEKPKDSSIDDVAKAARNVF